MEKPPTWVEIDLDALIHNIELIRRVVTDDVRILLVAKADAYGHGAVEIARAAETHVDGFAVARVDEATELAIAGIKKKLLVISPVLTREISTVVEHGFVVTVTTEDFARALSDCAVQKGTRAKVHIEVDTGMGRAGVLPAGIHWLLERITKLSGLQIDGMFTHFPVSETDREFTSRQIEQFLAVVDRVKAAGIDVPVLHCANSAAIAAIRESHLGLVRPGLIAYGHSTGDAAAGLALRPVMRWKCRVTQMRDLPAGATISYGRTCTTKRRTAMAVLPVGYGDGYPLRLSNRGEVVVSGTRAPIMGRVTMDMTMVDVTDVTPRPQCGDEVVLMGVQNKTEITVGEIAGWVGTIPYEILTGIGKRVPRIYIRDGKWETYKSLLGVMPTA